MVGPIHTRDRWRAGGARLALTIAVALHATPPAAEDGVPADPWQVIHIAREFGHAQVGSDAMRDPQIEATVDGVPYRINFYGCRLGRNCDTILFEARFERKEWKENPPRAKVFAGWNRAKLFGRAWLDDRNRAVLDHPVTMVGGVSQENLRGAFARWRAALREYAEHLDF